MKCERCGETSYENPRKLFGQIPARLCLPCDREYHLWVTSLPEWKRVRVLKILDNFHYRQSIAGSAPTLEAMEAVERRFFEAEQAIGKKTLAWIKEGK